eukprot:s1551_g9.t1
MAGPTFPKILMPDTSKILDAEGPVGFVSSAILEFHGRSPDQSSIKNASVGRSSLPSRDVVRSNPMNFQPRHAGESERRRGSLC